MRTGLVIVVGLAAIMLTPLGAIAQTDTSCLPTVLGDVDLNGVRTSADIIYLVNYIFKGGSPPAFCEAVADMNCDGFITMADVLAYVWCLFTFIGCPDCDICALIPEVWQCPPP